MLYFTIFRTALAETCKWLRKKMITGDGASRFQPGAYIVCVPSIKSQRLPSSGPARRTKTYNGEVRYSGGVTYCVPKPSCLPPFRPRLPTSTRRLLAHSRVISSWAAEGPPALVRYSFAPVCIRQVRNQPHEAWGLDTSMVFTMASRRSSVAARGTSCCISQYVGWPLQKPVNGYGRK